MRIRRTLALAAICGTSLFPAAVSAQSGSVSSQGVSVEASGKPAERTHVVLPGESLWTIARRHGMTVGALAQANGLRTDRALQAGRTLTIPGRSAKPGTVAQKVAPRRFYTVRKGDSLSRIAKRFGTTPAALAAKNGLRLKGIIHPGQRLEVPALGGSSAAKAPAVAPATAGDEASRLVETAMRYRGVRYRYGGITTRGMDCSGLVSRVLDLNGIDAPHNSRALYALGKAVPRDKLAAGDLVFFNTRGRGISHVGIYIGDGKFIHASSAKGRVRVDTLREGYYHRRYVGARRVG